MARKYSQAAQNTVEQTMHEFNGGKLHSGKSKKKVTNPRQAVAIGLSKARHKGQKVDSQK